MRNLLIILTCFPLFFVSCKKDNSINIPDGTSMKFEIHTDQPVFSLTVRSKYGKNRILLPAKRPELYKTYYSNTGHQMFQYNESIIVSTGDRIEFSVPRNNQRKVLKIGAVLSEHNTKYFQGMQSENDTQVVIFFVPEK